jgi:HEAT repeat protein
LALFVTLSPCHLVTLSSAKADYDPIIDSPMYHRPESPTPKVVYTFPKTAKELWLRALERPDAETKCRVAYDIALAHRDGVGGFEAAIEPLRKVFDQPDQHPLVRLAVAEALIALDARQTAESLFRQSQKGDSDLRELVEPVLARWDYQPARAVWLDRLRDPATPQRKLVLAIQGLTTVREAQAAERLREMVLSERTVAPIRLESARALGTLREFGLERDAERLAADPSPRGLIARLAAASLLRRHKGEPAVALLQRLARDPAPSVAAVAVTRLLEIDPSLVVGLVKQLLDNPDANVRLLAIQVLHLRPTEEHLRLLNARTDDEHLQVRRTARGYLLELAQRKEWRKQIIADANGLLKSERWRGLEQASILLTQLDHKAAAGRLVELLSFNRLEVNMAAAWGLRKLDIPETLPGVLRFVEGKTKKSNTSGLPSRREAIIREADDHILSQLNQFMGQQKYRPADPLFRAFIPKLNRGVGPGPESRAAAIWGLGMIHEGKAEDALASELEGRLNDTASMPPEYSQVRWMSAVTLGRMKAKKSLDSLRKSCPTGKVETDPVSNACGWAIERITGEALRPADTIYKVRGNWFLTPQQ